jgi:hypothetical protein
MAVAHDAASESDTGTTGTASTDSFTWSHTGAANVGGVLVGVLSIAATDQSRGVTYGGVPLRRVLPFASDTSTELGTVALWFRGEGLPPGAQDIVVTRVNDATVMYAVAATVTAATPTECGGRYVQVSNDSAWVEQTVDDGSPGTNSTRYAFGYTGAAAPIAAGANSTLLNSIDFGAFGAMFAVETTAGQGSRSIGFNSAGGSDDNATVHVAIRERPTVGVWHSMASRSGSSGTASVASFTWDHPEGGTPSCVQVHVVTVASAAVETGVTYGGVAMTLDAALTASAATPEPGCVRVWVLNAGIPEGTQPVVVTRTNNATVAAAACVTQYASGSCEIYSAGVVITNTVAAETELSPTDNSPGTASLRYAATYSGTTTHTQGTNTVEFIPGTINLSLREYRLGWELLGGQGARPVGFTALSDDRAGSYYAVRLIAPSARTERTQQMPQLIAQ